MAKQSMIQRWKRTPKFSARAYNRCNICGCPRSYIRDFGICRHCFRKLASLGQIPGVVKSSW